MDEQKMLNDFMGFLQKKIEDFYASRETYSWFLEKVNGVQKIINIGCGGGAYGGGLQTVKLCFALDAYEAIGVDRHPANPDEPDPISGADAHLNKLKRTIEIVRDSQQHKVWWEKKVPSFFKNLLSNTSPSFSYHHWDITTDQTLFLPGSFDLAYCERVLSKIWCSENENDVILVVTNVIRRIENLVGSGGFLVVNDFIESGGRFIKLKPILGDVGFNVESYPSAHKNRQHLIAQKP